MPSRKSYALAAVVLGLGGCQFIPVTLNAPEAPGWVGGIQRGGGTDIVVVAPFTDRRPHPDVCGIKKDGMGRPTAKVYCNDVPGRLLAHMVSEGLSSAGFHVIGNPNDAKPSTLIVSAAVEQTFVEQRIGFTSTTEADIGVTVGVATRDGLRARRSFYVKGTDPYAFAIDRSVQLAYDTAARELALDVVGAIETLAERPVPRTGAVERRP